MSTGRSSFEIGATIGDYRIISVIGRGGMGKVFKVRDLLSDRTEAMQVRARRNVSSFSIARIVDATFTRSGNCCRRIFRGQCRFFMP